MLTPRRAVFVALTVACAGLTTASHAAVKVAPVCKLLVDDAGDTKVMGQVKHQDDAMDILSADVASNAKEVTAVIRVKKYAATDQTAPLGRSYYLLWAAKGAPGPVFLSAGVYPNANEFVFGFLDETATPGRFTSLGSARGVFDADKSEIRVTAAISDLVKNKLGTYKAGEKLASLKAEARSFTGQNVVQKPTGWPSQAPFIRGLVHVVDDATATKSYSIGAPSCVAVGK